jgi:DNA-damage-inducible protein D
LNEHDSNLPAPASSSGASPFDQIRRQDNAGEWWSARDLQPLMGYQRWEDFSVTVIGRAIRSSENTGTFSEQAFSVIAEDRSGGRPRTDYRLSRQAAYLVAMNGDPNKPQVAQAQVYFAEKTRMAEVLQMPTHAVALRGWAAELEAREEAERRAAELTAENKVLAPKAGKWDQFLNCEGLIGMTPLADILGIHVTGLTEYLVEIGVFRKQASRFGSNHNMPRRAYQTSGHFKVKVESNGKVSYEVAYATPTGADLVADLWAKRAAA